MQNLRFPSHASNIWDTQMQPVPSVYTNPTLQQPYSVTVGNIFSALATDIPGEDTVSEDASHAHWSTFCTVIHSTVAKVIEYRRKKRKRPLSDDTFEILRLKSISRNNKPERKRLQAL